MLSIDFISPQLTSSKTRNVSLPGAEPYPTIESLPKRFLDNGFTTSRALNLREIRGSYIDPPELKRYDFVYKFPCFCAHLIYSLNLQDIDARDA